MLPRLTDLTSRGNDLRGISGSVLVRDREGSVSNVPSEEERTTVRSSRSKATILALVCGSATKLCNSLSLVAESLGREGRGNGDSCSEVVVGS